jgi:hypothetical protein
MARIAERLKQTRQRQTVGRESEIAVLTDALDAPELPFVVLSIVGPGGIGKTVLLRALAGICEGRGLVHRQLDGRLIEPTPESLEAALAGVGSSGGREVVLLDGFEALAALEGWLREIYLPNLSGEALFVLAGRVPLSIGWRTDSAWQELIQTLPLRNLAPDASRQYLEGRGLSGDALESALRFTHGYPLALALVAEVHQQKGSVALGPDPPPDVVQTLLERFLEDVPSSEHRAALEVGALLRVTTEPLLARILERPEAHALFDWLRSLSFIEPGLPGVYPQEVARESLLADLRWRSPDRYADLHRRARAAFQDGLTQASEADQLRILWDYIFLHRDNPIARQAFLFQDSTGVYPDRALPEDLRVLQGLVQGFEGEESARWLLRWWDDPAATFTVYRSSGRDTTPQGFLLCLALDKIEDEESDPAARAAYTHLKTHAPLRRGETATLFRFWMARETYHSLSPVQSQILVGVIRHYLTTPGLAYTLFPVRDAAFWGPLLEYSEYARASDADFTTDNQLFSVFAHDWRTQTPAAWLDVLAEKELAGHAAQVATSARPTLVSTPVVLSEEEFARAVRSDLKSLARGEELIRSPLLRARVVAERLRGGEVGLAERASALKSLLRETIQSLEGHPRRDRAYRALLHTMLRPAPSQEKAAEILDLPFSTYRRHLGEGIELVVQALWLQEIGNALK